MKALAQMIVRVVELLEAEGRTLRRALFNLALALLALIVATILCIGALGLFAGAIFCLLQMAIGTAGALAVMGGILLLLAIIAFLSAHMIQQRKASRP